MRTASRRYSNLDRLLQSSPVVQLGQDAKVVIFSDLHLGDGSSRDEFLHNSDLFGQVLERRYLERQYGLVLNGDIEELMKFSCQGIVDAWGWLYELFISFGRAGGFWKIYGNHDQGLLEERGYPLAPWLLESLVFRYGEQSILLFHGHQASPFLNSDASVFSQALRYLLRYIAKPAGIRNYSVSHDSRKRYLIERSVYEFSTREGIVSIIGHTHRPLFESLSKIDYLNYRIEELCRAYPSASDSQRSDIEEEIDHLKDALDGCYRKGYRKSLRIGRYGNIPIPSIFNSGCAIGKRGITAIEIDNGMIRLVYWQKTRPDLRKVAGMALVEEFGLSGCYRIVLNEDRLDYIFSRIRLLSGSRMKVGRKSDEHLSLPAESISTYEYQEMGCFQQT